LIVLVGSLFVSLVIAEVALRVLGIGYGNAPSNGHPVLHHIGPANHRMRVYTPSREFGGFDTYWNADGLPMKADLPPRGTPSIVFLGDSFTEGLQVAEGDRFVSRVGRDLGLPTINLGCSSYMPVLERLRLETFADRISPRAVVVQIYANDVADGVLMDTIAVRDARGRIVAVPGTRTPLWTRLARRSYVARLARKAWLSAAYTRDKEKRSGGAWGGEVWSPSFTKPLTEWFSPRELEIFERGLAELRDVCREHRWPLLLWVIPDRGSRTQGVRDHFYEHVRAVSDKLGIRFIDVAPFLPREQMRALFFPQDIHMTARGHAHVARALDAALKELSASEPGPPR
jgi:hypothetical protein